MSDTSAIQDSVSPQQASPAVSAEPAFDAEDTMGRLGDDYELFAELVESFHQDSSRGLSDIRHSIDAGDPQSLADAAHTLRGVVSIFGAGPAIRATLALERAANEGTLAGLDDRVSNLEEILERLALELSRFTPPVA